MTKFRFRVYDAKTRKVRKGKIEADDVESAHRQLVARGLQVQSLTSDIEVRDVKNSGWSLDQASQQQFTYRPTLLERLSGIKLTSATSKLLLGCLIVLGGLVFYSQWSGLGGEAPKGNPRKDTAIEIRGRFAGAVPTDMTIRLRLSEIPYSQTRALDKLLDPESAFVLKVVFSATRVPSYCDIELQAPGQKPVVVCRARLSGLPLSADLGTITLNQTR